MKKNLILLSLFALSTSACDGASTSSSTGASADPPSDYSQYLVYIADGTYDLADPNFVPPTLEELQRDSWHWSDTQIAEFEVESKAFFLERFGVDVDDPENAERLNFVPVVLEPRANYRVVTMANREVPPEGWAMSDGSFQVFLEDPDGFELGGDFAGITVPQGTFMTYGYYQIITDEGEEIVIGFKSLNPIVPSDIDVSAFRCELWSDDYGTGEAHGVYRFYQEANGDATFTIRNVLTFD